MQGVFLALARPPWRCTLSLYNTFYVFLVDEGCRRSAKAEMLVMEMVANNYTFPIEVAKMNGIASFKDEYIIDAYRIWQWTNAIV